MLEIHFSFVYVCMVEFDLRIFFNGNWCWKYILSNINSNLNFINNYECEFAVLQTFKYVFFKTFISVNTWKCRFLKSTLKRQILCKNRSTGDLSKNGSLKVKTKRLKCMDGLHIWNKLILEKNVKFEQVLVRKEQSCF